MFSNNKKINEILLQIENLKDRIKVIEDTNENLVKKLSNYDNNIDDFIKNQEKKSGTEPHIEIVSESFDPEHGIELKLDWNESMINFLKRNGYVGKSDDEIIEKYISDLLKHKLNNENYE